MKDLKLKVGDKCYIGREEFTVIDYNKERSTIKNDNATFYVFKDGRLTIDLPPIVSLEPYDFPEMVCEKPLEIGKPHYFWDKGFTGACYGILSKIDRSKDFPFMSEGYTYMYCSLTPPELPIK